MSVLAVDTAALARLAERIRGAAAEARAVGARPGPLSAAAGALESPALVAAVIGLGSGWGWVLREITDDADRMADAVDLVARSYQDADSLVDSTARLPGAARPVPGGAG